MKILFSFENALPCREADAEVFVHTASALTTFGHHGVLVFPHADSSPNELGQVYRLNGLPLLQTTRGPGRPAVLRHAFHALLLARLAVFRNADFVYTRNLFVCFVSVMVGKPVLFDHYRPWGDQVPPLRGLLHWLAKRTMFLGIVAHSEFAAASYARAGVPKQKIRVIHTGYAPERFAQDMTPEAAKEALGLPVARPTVVYTGRINERKGLESVLDLAQRLPQAMFVLVGSYGEGDIEARAKQIPNVRIVAWQHGVETWRYQQAADVLIVPPSSAPLREHGNTVLPLKLFSYLAAGRPIFAAATPDIEEILRHDGNAWLVAPDDPAAAAAALQRLLDDEPTRQRLAAEALHAASQFTWDARAVKITAFVVERLQARLQSAQTTFDVGGWLRDTAKWCLRFAVTGKWLTPERQDTAPTPAPALTQRAA